MGEHFSSLPVPPASCPGTFPSSWLCSGCHGGCFGTIVGVVRGPWPRPTSSGKRAGAKGAPRAAELCQRQTQPHLHYRPGPGLSVATGYFWCFLICPALPAGCFCGFAPPGRRQCQPLGLAAAVSAGASSSPQQHGGSVAGATQQQGRLVLQVFMALPALPCREAVPAEPAFAA